MDNLDKTLKYYELLMVKNNIKSDIQDITVFPGEYTIVFWKNEKDIEDWINIHISSEEFASKERALIYFHSFYDNFIDELKDRLFFIESNGDKIATATISPTDKFGYNCVIDWLAIKKEYQGRHLAKPLINECLKIAFKLGYNKILLHTQTHTWLASKLYLDCGFEPFMMEKNIQGWQILKTLTNHDKLREIKPLSKNELYDSLTLNIVNELNKHHKHYNYEIWYINDMNDIWVSENKIYYHYKFYNQGKEIKLCDTKV